MSFGSFFTRALDVITPWNRGGEVVRTQQRKKKQEEEQRYNVSRPSVQSPRASRQITPEEVIQPKRPTNVFEDLNKNLVLNKPQNALSVMPKQPPQPGTVIHPTTRRIDEGLDAGKSWEQISRETGTDLNTVRSYSQKTRPNYGVKKLTIAPNYKKPSIWQTIKDTAVGTVSNLPEVGLAATRAGTGIVQGALNLPHDLTALAATGTEKLKNRFNNPITRQVNRGFQNVNTGVKTALHHTVNNVFDPVNRNIDEAARIYERNVPTATAGAKAYRATQVPINLLAAALTLGATSAGRAGQTAEVVGNTNKTSKVIEAIKGFLNKPLIQNEENLVSKVGRPVINRVRPLSEAINAPIRSTREGINNLRSVINNRGVQSAERGVVDVGTTENAIKNLLSEADIADINKTTRIPVTNDIPVTGGPSFPESINVRNTTPRGPVIREAGDTGRITRQSTEDLLAARQQNRFKNQDFGLPDENIEGVTPRPTQEPFKLNESSVGKSQDELIDQYAEQLRSMGEGNGVAINSETKQLISSNYRTPETKGKSMTQAMWRDEAERQLKAGQADPSIQGAFNDATNPEVQSLVNESGPPVEKGQPIRVKEATGINVMDKTEVPQNLPETPGKVRVTKNTEPAKAKAETVAKDMPSVVTVKNNKTGERSYYRPKTQTEYDELVKRIDGDRMTSDGIAGLPDSNGNVVHVTAGGTEKLDKAGYKEVDSIPDERFGAKTPAATTPKQADETLASAQERLVKSLRENQAAQKVEKKLNKAEKSRRFAEKQRIYDELVASGASRKEAEAQATKALAGKYIDNTVANFDVDSKQAEAFRKAIDEISDDPHNTKRAFEHLIDPDKTDPLQPWERTRIRQFVQKSLGEDAAQALDEAILLAEQTGDRTAMGKVADFTTSAIAAGDISAVGRQGLFGLVNHPKMSGQAFKEAMGALVDSKKYDEFARKLANDPNTAFIQENMGGKYLTLSDIADEARGGDTTNRAISWYVNPSNRHYNTYLDSLRHQQKAAIIERYGGQNGFLKAAQAANSEHPEKWMKAWGNVVDRMSGRGSFSATGSPTVGDMQVLFSARNLASKFQRLTAPLQVGLLKTNPEAYLYQLREVAQPAAALGTALTLVGATGLADIENGKIKIGNTRIDVTGGFATIVNAMNNVRKAFTEESDSGFARTGWDVTKDFFQNQLSPVLGTIGQLMDIKSTSEGMQDRYGNNVDIGWLLAKAPIPAIAQTAIDSKTGGESWYQTAGNVFSEGLGFGANTYKTAEDKQKAKSTMPENPTLKQVEAANNKPDGSGLVQTNDGKYAYTINGETKSADTLEKAQEELAKEGLKNSDESYKIIGDKVYRKDAEGDVGKPTPKIKYDEMVNTATLSKKKKADDLQGWFDTANKQLKNIDEQLKDPNIDPLEKIRLENAAETLLDQMDKYNEYGGFTKYGKGGKGRKGPKLDTSFGQLRAGSFAPRVQQYAGIDSRAGNIPMIRTVRPNIVHKITSSG